MSFTKLDETKCKLLKKFIIGNELADIGCAAGFYTAFLEKNKRAIIGLDINLKLLSKAKNSFRINASVTSLPMKDNSVDTSILFDVLEHVKEEVLHEVIRITRKRIIITVPRTTDEELRDNWLLFGHHQDPTHKRTYTEKSFERLLKKLKLKKVSIMKTHPISTESLLIELLEGPLVIRKLIRKIAFTFSRPKIFYSNIFVVADLTNYSKYT